MRDIHDESLARRRSTASLHDGAQHADGTLRLEWLLALLHAFGYRPVLCSTGEGWLIAVRGEAVIATSSLNDLAKLCREVRAYVRREGLPVPAEVRRLVS